MTKGLAICGTLAVALLLAPAGIGAHHPIATQFDSDQEKTLQGTVEQFNWRSPHSELVLSVRENGETARWTLELDSPETLNGLGWSRDTVGQGDRVTVVAWPARDGSKQAVAKSITLDDGRELAALNPHDPAYAPASAARSQGDVAADHQRESSAQDRPVQDQEAQDRSGQDRDADAAAQVGTAREGEVHLVGCVELERDYRARTDGSRGGLLGTGLGAANEFVLVNATPGPPEAVAPADRAVGTSGERAEPQAERQDAEHQDRSQADRQGEPHAVVGTSGDEMKVFSLTGDQESTLTRAVGRQVHVVGMVEESGRDGGLPRVNISVWHPVQDFCPAP